MSNMDNIYLKHFVSSANLNSCEVMADGKSKGPSMLSCGTPEMTGRVLDTS